jgi:NTE family protein
MREMRAISFVTKLTDEGKIVDNSLRRMLIHAVTADDVMAEFGVASKLNADWGFLVRLRDVGRERAASWLDASWDRLGVDSTVDVRNAYL